MTIDEAALQVAVDEFRTVHASNGENLHASIRRAITAYEAAKTAEGPVADVARWKRDSELLSAIQDQCWDVRFTDSPNADAGDYNVNIEIIGHFMADPKERVVGENYSEDLRAALEQAMTAEPYPPARPLYAAPPPPQVPHE